MGVARVDLAIAADGLLAVVPGVGSTVTIPAVLDPASGGVAEELMRAMASLEHEVLRALGVSDAEGGTRFQIRTAVLPPFCEVRLLELPELGDEETELLIRRNASRHFIGAARDLSTSFARFGGTTKRDGRTLLVAATSDSFLEALRIAVESRGWVLETVAPAVTCWIRILEEAIPGAARRSSGDHGAPVRALVAVEGSTLSVLRFSGETPDQLRRAPVGDSEALAAAVGPVPGKAVVLAAEPQRAALAAELRSKGWIVEAERSIMTAREAAARGIEGSRIEFVPAPVLEARQRRSRQLGRRLLAAGGMLFVTAGAVQLASLARAIRTAEDQRAELSAQVAPVAAARDSLDSMVETLQQLHRLEESARPLTVPLIELSVLLPPESHLVSLRVAGDTAVLEAAGGRAGTALAALRSASTLTDVRLEGTIQREIEAGATAGERFTLSALLDTSADEDGASDAPAAVGGGR